MLIETSVTSAPVLQVVSASTTATSNKQLVAMAMATSNSNSKVTQVHWQQSGL